MRHALWRFWSSWFGGVATCALVAAVAGLAIVFGGLYNTGADNPHLRIVARAVHDTMISSVRKRTAQSQLDHVAPPIDHAMLVEGTKVYESHCLGCHGGPGVARAPWAAAMLPTPPYIVDSAKRWSRAELHELVAHGVKMSGMPAWAEIIPERQVIAVTALTAVMPRLGTRAFEALRNEARAQPTTPLDASGPTAAMAPQPLGVTQPLDRTVRTAPTVEPRTKP